MAEVITPDRKGDRMPYEYRKLTPEEREEVVRQRLAAGYPAHSPPHPFPNEGWYLVSAANYEHAAIMARPARRTEFQTRLLAEMHSIRAEVGGWVVLPNHYHILLGVASFVALSGALRRLHGPSSREWNLEDGLTGRRRVWYKFSDRAIRDEAHFWRAFNYVHINAVKHGYVTDPYAWPWTSLHIYLEAQGREWLREKWVAYPTGQMGKGWDD